MQKLILIVLFGISTTYLNAQADRDSLYAVWQDETQSDSSRALAYQNYILDGFLFFKPDSAIVLAQSLMIFGEQHQYKKANASAYWIMGVANYAKSNSSKALDYYQRSLKISEEIGDKNGSARVLTSIGSTYKLQNDYFMALDYYQRSLKISEEIGDKNGSALTLGNTGTVYQEQGDYPRALDYYQRSLKIKQEIGDDLGSAITISNIGIIYEEQDDYPNAMDCYQRSLKIRQEIGDRRGIADAMTNIGNLYAEQGDHYKAMDYNQRSLKIYEEIGYNLGIAIVIGNIGDIYKEQGDYPKALDYYQRSLKISEEIGDNWGRALIIGAIGSIYKEQGETAKALEYCKKALSISKEMGLLDTEKEACQCLYNTYKAMNKGNEALMYLEKINVINNSLNAQETSKKLQQMEFVKQVFSDSIASAEKKRLVQEAHEKEVRKKNRIRNGLMVGGLFFVLLAGGVYSRLRYIRKSKVQLQDEKDRSDNLLLNILPAEIAEELKAKGRAEARDFDLVSILFTDFKEFTQTSEKLSAQELVSEINTCFEAFDVICEKHKVEKIKTIGDSYMGAGGLPIPTDDSVKNTVLAGIDMAQFITYRKGKLEEENKIAFAMRVGIHTGPVVAGIVGTKKFQYDIWGDTVNTASRMESGGEAGKVNISQTIYEILKEDPEFTFESRGKIEAKGKGEMEMYFVSLKNKY